MKISSEIRLSLSAQSVVVGRSPQHPLSSAFPDFIAELKDWCSAKTDGVAISYFFRQYALFITAQFDLITRHGCYYSGSWRSLRFDCVHNYGYPLLHTHVTDTAFSSVCQKERFSAFHYVLTEQMDDFILEFRKYIKISPIILWENVLGSLLWYYANLERQDPRRTAEDLEWLMEPANWLPIKTSYMAKLLGSANLKQAVSSPLRQTCCLYKELPQFSICTFCPAVR